ncbi:MAG: phosphatase PAP2 family protein [Saprospiraceae bacterium]|nr:phosphatase PAP2 family protein [Saprospiraceae bacterium]
MKKVWFLSLIFLCIVLNNQKNFAQNFDYQTLKNIESYRSDADTRFYKFLSDADAPICVAAPVLLTTIGLIKKDKKLTRQGLEIGIAFTATVAETYILKYSVNRPRPYITYKDLNPLSSESSRSFPSGHTSAAFSTAMSLSLNFPKWYVAVPAFAWASATGYSRMYLGVHYPTDVLTGAVLGAGTAWLTHEINKKLQKR